MAPQGFMTSSGHRLVEEVHELAEGVLLGADRIPQRIVHTRGLQAGAAFTRGASQQLRWHRLQKEEVFYR